MTEIQARKWRKFPLAAGVVVAASFLAVGCSASGSGETSQFVILKNAEILTQDEQNPVASVIALDGGEIVFVGSQEEFELSSFESDKAEVIDLEGKTVIPGLIDAHTHPGAVALSSWHIALPETNDVTEILEFLKTFAAENSVEEVPFIYAEYYPSAMDWGDGDSRAELINEYVSDRPVLLQDFSDHASTVNSTMLDLMGVDASTALEINADDSAQQFVRGTDGKTPTGEVLEGGWRVFSEPLFDEIGWEPPSEVTPELLQSFTGQLSEEGVTGLFDAIARESTLQAASELDQAGKLNMDYSAATLFTSVDDLDDGIAELQDFQKRFGSDHIEVNTMKLFLDGTNEIGTSAVIEPFHSDEGGTGELRVSQEDLTASLLKLNAEGIDLHIHVVGDRGFRVALDSVADAQTEAGDDWSIQVTLAHNEIVDPADMPRVAELGVILNWTPHWSGGYFGEGAAEYLGWDRFNRMYQFNPVIATGGIVTFGSDVVTSYEAARANPFFGMQIAATRVDPEYPMEAGEGTVPGTEERQAVDAELSVEDLLRGYTSNAAVQLRIDDKTGSLKAGNKASLVVLGSNPLTIDTDKLSGIVPEAVMFEGNVVQGSIGKLGK